MDLPPSYNEVVRSNYNSSSGTVNRTYVDFAPLCLERGGLFSSAKYETFSQLTIKANQWLNANPSCFVEGCETIGIAPEHKIPPGMPDNTQQTRYHIGIVTTSRRVGNSTQTRRHATINLIKCLRLYVRVKTSDESPEPHQIGYLNVSPQLISPSGFFTSAKFDGYDETLKQFNEYLDRNPISGKIVSIETVTINRDNNYTDVDGSRIKEDTRSSSQLSTMLRLFYLVGPPLYEKIGSADFRPAITKAGGIFSEHQFETISQTTQKVRSWISSQSAIRVTNCKTMKIDYEKALKPNITQRIDYVLSKHTLRKYFYVIRVFYVTGPNVRVDRPISLSCRTFIPAISVTKTIGRDVYETLDKLYLREIAPFIRYNSFAQVINFEIVPINPHIDQQAMCNTKSIEYSPLMVASVKVYFDGNIREPTINVMQPRQAPVHQDIDCCTIC